LRSRKWLGVVTGFDEVAVVGEAVEERGGHFGVAEDLDPDGEEEVGGDDEAGALVAVVDQVIQERAARLGERLAAKLIEDDGLDPGELTGQGAGFALGLLLLQAVDQVDDVVEAHAPATVDGGKPSAVARYLSPVSVRPTRIRVSYPARSHRRDATGRGCIGGSGCGTARKLPRTSGI
jgi:hypothetical protein